MLEPNDLTHLGEFTILLACCSLGPIARPAQFVSPFAASFILIEIGREQEPVWLERDQWTYPSLAGFTGLARWQGLWFSVLIQLLLIFPIANAASVVAAFFSVSRRDFMLATMLGGWVRPVGFVFLGTLGRFTPICRINPSATMFKA